MGCHLILLLAAACTQTQIAWTEGSPKDDYAELAKTSSRPYVVLFCEGTADPYALDPTDKPLSSAELVGLSEKYTCVWVAVTAQTQATVRRHYKVAGFPTLRFYNAEGQIIDEIVGRVPLPKLIEKFRQPGGVWKTAPLELDATKWYDTHRVYLRNGNVLEGRLKMYGEEGAILVYDTSCELFIERDGIERVEWISIRRVDDPPATVLPALPTLEPCPKCGAKRDSATAACSSCEKTQPTAAPSNTLSDESKQRVLNLIEQLNTAQDKNAVTESLAKCGSHALVYAASLLDQVSVDQANWIIAAITRAKERRAASTLRQKLSAMNTIDLMERVIWALGALGDANSAPTLRKLLSHESARIREVAIDALAQMGDRISLRELCKMVVDVEETVRKKAAGAVIVLAKNPRLKLESEAYQALRSLPSNIPDARREQVPLVLAQLGLKEGANHVMGYLRSREKTVRENAVKALMDLGATAAIPQFYLMLETEQEPSVKTLVCSALERLKDYNAVPKLISLLGRERDTDVKLAATRALQRLTPRRFGPDYEEWKKWWDEERGTRPDQ